MKDTRQQWFKEAKYGLFIHWGLYSILAGEYKGVKTYDTAEWIMNTLDIPVAEYEKLADKFNPTSFDAEYIVCRAKEWGMRYLVFTTKHHDGFAMYHSKCSSYNIVDASPYGRDVTKELELACKKYDMKFGLYYSQAQDWHDPDGFKASKDNSKKNFRKYMDGKCIPQLKELLTGYGDIALIWFDTPMGMKKEESLELFDLVKSIQPDCLVSGRIGNNIGEYMTTRDNRIPLLPYNGDWEVPATLNDTWGFRTDDDNWKSPDDIIRLLLKINGRGGNYLINIGPDACGNIPRGSEKVLDNVGNFIKSGADGIYGTKRVEVYPYDLEWALFTKKDYKLFVHIIKPVTRCIISNIANTIVGARLLGSGETLRFDRRENCEDDTSWEIMLPENIKNKTNITICLDLEEKDPVFTPIL